MSTTPDRVGLTHCKFVLVFAVLTDLFGVSALLIGLFVPLEIGGRDSGDLFVYSGALLVLMSMGGWVMWYSGNIEGLISGNELTHKRNAVDRLVRTLSRRIKTPPRPQHIPTSDRTRLRAKGLGYRKQGPNLSRKRRNM